ncbi:MAG: multidrug ABC transporter [Clostridia bacterium]|nr:multidrug ABC transporter [Clostridia bacterium]
MNSIMYASILIFGVFISSISQIILKKSADKKRDSIIKEYLNPYVIGAYTIFIAATLLSILAYRGIPLSLGPILEASGYLFVTLWGLVFFGEKLSFKKVIALVLIVSGIVVYSFG